MIVPNRILRRAGATLGAGIVAFNLFAAPALAASNDIIDNAQRGSITIHKYDMTAAQKGGVDLSQFRANGEKDTNAESKLKNYALQGVQFDLSRAADISTYSDSGNVEVVYNPKASLRNVLNLNTSEAVTSKNGDYYFTSDQINDALEDLLEDNTAGKDKLEAWAVQNGSNSLRETDSNGTTSSGNLDLGLYLVIETAVPEEVFSTTDPFFVSVPMTDATGDRWFYNVDVYPKNQCNNPTLDKLVSENGTYADTATASEGDVLNYRLVSQLPTISSTATYLNQYTYVDELSKGLAYNRDVVVSFYNNENDAKNGTGSPVATWTSKANPTLFNTAYESMAGGSRLTVTPTKDGFREINTKYSDLYMVVSYTVTVTSAADTVLGDNGNMNDVKLTYSRTNSTYYNTIEDKAIVYSYGINLQKNFADNAGDATHVQFVLKNASDNYFVTADGENGNYYVKGQATSEKDGSVFSPNADGSLVINGLEADTYILTEIQTDAGYSLLRDPITIEIKETDTTILASKAAVTGLGSEQEDCVVTMNTSASAAVDNSAAAMSAYAGSENGLVDMSVLNSRSFLLPATGGEGTAVLTICGVLTVAGGVALMKGKKNEKAAA